MTDRSTPAQPEPPADAPVDFYGANYGHFGEAVYAEVRRAAFGEDMGQNSWHTVAEQDRFLTWLALGPGAAVLDVACGAGGPTLRLARQTGAAVLGVDIHRDGVAAAAEQARRLGLAEQARFEQVDASQPLPFAPASFDAVICIDAINHLPDRSSVLAEWARVLKPGGRVLFTDPIVVTGPLTNAEIATRGAIGFFLFVPPGEDERLLDAAGLRLERSEDVTAAMAEVAGRWGAARAARAADLRRLEGEATFAGQQEFLRVAALIARERRLSRFAFLASKPTSAG
jgi:2-polyprenyl-3-methyl-5-hydroxy-6-metoxy-1,4-benzoquinol methylase